MKIKILALTTICLVVISIVLGNNNPGISDTTVFWNFNFGFFSGYYNWMHVEETNDIDTTEIRTTEIKYFVINGDTTLGDTISKSRVSYTISDNIIRRDTVPNYYYKVGEGEHCQVWVAAKYWKHALDSTGCLTFERVDKPGWTKAGEYYTMPDSDHYTIKEVVRRVYIEAEPGPVENVLFVTDFDSDSGKSWEIDSRAANTWGFIEDNGNWYAMFHWSPSGHNPNEPIDEKLISPLINLDKSYDRIELLLNHEFESFDSNVDTIGIYVLDNNVMKPVFIFSGKDITGENTISYDITSVVNGDFKLVFRIWGDESWAVNYWKIYSIEVKGIDYTDMENVVEKSRNYCDTEEIIEVRSSLIKIPVFFKVEGNGIVDSSVVEEVIRFFEDSTGVIDSNSSDPILNSSMGLYDKLTSIFGEPKWVSETKKVSIALTDVVDNYGTESPGAPYRGYFDPNAVDKYEITFSGHTVFFVDVDPTIASGELYRGIASNFQHLLNWSIDPLQVKSPPGRDWLDEGLAVQAEFFAGLGFNKYINQWESETPMPEFPDVTGLDNDPYNRLRVHKGSFVHYIWQRFGNDILRELVEEEGTATMDDVSEIIQNYDPSVTVEDVFTDWVLANFFDIPEESFHGGRYGFKYFERKQITVGAREWRGTSAPPFRYNLNNWNAIFTLDPFQAKGVLTGSELDTTIVTRMDVDHKYRLVEIRSPMLFLKRPDTTSNIIIHTDMDSLNRTTHDVDSLSKELYQTFFNIIVTFGPKDPQITTSPRLVECDDMIPPEELNVAILQNNVTTNLIDIYVFSNEGLYTDHWDDENINLKLICPNDTIEIDDEDVQILSNTEFGEIHVYKCRKLLSDAGNYEVHVEARDIAGWEAECEPINFVAKKVSPDASECISSENGEFKIKFEKGSFDRETFVTLVKVENSNIDCYTLSKLGKIVKEDNSLAFSSVYQVGPQCRLNKEVEIVFSTNICEENLNGIGVFYKNDDGNWEEIPSIVNINNGEITARSKVLGQFQLRKGASLAEIVTTPVKFELQQNYPNPFNSSTKIRFSIPDKENVYIAIYNTLGERVKTLVKNQSYNPGVYEIIWDGTNEFGEKVSSGMYFYMLKSGEYMSIRKMVLIK